MSLPSQLGRVGPAGSGGRSRTFMISRRKRARRRPLIAFTLLAGLGGLIAYVWMQKPPAGGPAEAATITSDESRPEESSASRFPFDFGDDDDVQLPPANVELTMGGKAPTREEPAPQEKPADKPEEPTSIPAEPVVVPDPAPAAPEQTRSITVIDAAERELAKNNLIGARSLLETALRSRTTDATTRDHARAMIAAINDDLIFSPRVHPGEALTESYKVKGGDSLSVIASRQGLATDWRLIQRVNRISDPTKIREGQPLKLVRGPFHAIVDKSEYRLDLFVGSPDAPRDWRYVRSFDVGLGEDNSTPTGEFVIRKGSKLVNPHWVNPRTGDRFGANDPANPIGEYWLGLEGLGEYAAVTGYGLHGTIDPDSIGSQRSMGCIRLADDDIAFVFELLIEGVSRVTIVE